MSGNCGVVAICVTHPLWPFRVPRRVICSVMAAAGREDGSGFNRGLGPIRSYRLRWPPARREKEGGGFRRKRK